MYRDQVLEAWRVEHPGTRPSRWWQYDAPRWPQDDMLERLRGAFFSADLPTPRRRLGGTGAPQFESLNVVPRFFKGVPVDWLDVDAADPPTYEAEAEYLHRHGLLSAAERTCYERGQLDLEPHVVTEGS
jgi:hypothetical protein